ncbi:MAG: class I SAM-dependent methyltransferase, partial [Gammaproteobacteria bacterium]|nr:class I SAM-dependent methyltransferase [Gammaproteobacteria bacterium]
RLKVQARLLEPVTKRFLREAGIAAGMHVLDIGSGAGDVAFLAAELVGPSGVVTGSDTAAAAVAAASRAAEERGLHNISFRQGDPARMEFEQRFDAVVGRYVLLFQSDPAEMLHRLSSHLHPGGVVMFHEPDWVSARSTPLCPTYEHCVAWIRDNFRVAGTDSDLAGKLYTAFVAAGLPAPSMRMETFIGGGAACSDFLQAVADLVGILVPTMERLGITTAAEVEVATLAERLKLEVITNGSVVVGRSEVGAWTRLPDEMAHQRS